MDGEKRKRLEAAGWDVGEINDFLDLSPAEAAFIETKLALARGLRQLREQRGLTQQQIAEAIGSSQSRVARMEAGDPSVTLDLLIRALLTLEVERPAVARLIAGPLPLTSSPDAS